MTDAHKAQSMHPPALPGKEGVISRQILLTGDETFVHFVNAETNKEQLAQWMHTQSPN